MPVPLVFRLNASQLSDLEHAILHSECPEVRKRAEALRLLHQGHPVIQVAQTMGVSDRAVRDWIHHYGQAGLNGLVNKPIPGRPRVISLEYSRMLENALCHSPQEFGYFEIRWTIPLLRYHLQRETACCPPISTLRDLLRRLGYVHENRARSSECPGYGWVKKVADVS